MLVPLARACYRTTPSRTARRLAFNSFAWVVHHGQMVAAIGGIRFDLDFGELKERPITIESMRERLQRNDPA